MKWNIPREVNEILKRYWENGYEAYLVGGCVRDFCLGKAPQDYDITTDALPEESKMLFSECAVLETGLQHGTVTLRYRGNSYEITTYRVDGEYLDHRRPTQVYFTKMLMEDLKRRDFTINAMAYYDRLIDYFDGCKDLENRQIRCVGDPQQRFHEDGLRILRALRFASVLNFSVAEETEKALFLKKELLSNIAKERIRTEWDKLLEGAGAERIVVRFRQVIEVFIPGFSPCVFPKHIQDGTLRFVLLLQQTYGNDIEQSLSVLRNLKYDNKKMREIRSLLEFLNLPFETDKLHIKQYLNHAGMDIVKKVALLKQLDLSDVLGEIEENNECYTLTALALKGEDLIKLGVPPGKVVGQMLETLLWYVMQNPSQNTPEALIKYIKEL